MNLVSIRIITSSTESLVVFYEQITGISAIRYTPDFAEMKTPNTTLAIGSTKTLQFFGGESVAQPAESRTAIIEFLVDDVDKEFERLKDFRRYKLQYCNRFPQLLQLQLCRGHLLRINTYSNYI